MTIAHDETESADNMGNVDMLPQPDDHATLKNLIFPLNTEPSPLTGFAVKICTGVLGEKQADGRLDGSGTIIHLAATEAYAISSCSLLTVFRCFGVCLCCCGCPRRTGALVSVCPLYCLGGLSESHLHCVQAATEQGKACL